jgi:hypothetical protein
MRRTVLALCVVAGACSTYGETANAPTPGADGGATSDASADGASENDASTAEGSTSGGAFCAAHSMKKLCDDFEGRTAPAEKWNGIKAEGVPATALAIVAKEAPFESAFLRVTVPMIASTDGGWSFLVHGIPGAPSSITVALTVRANGFGGSQDYVEVATIGGSTPERLVSLFVEAGQMHFGSKDAASSLAVGTANVRTRYEMTLAGATLRVRDANGAMLGETTLVNGPFTAPIYAGVGLTYADPTAGGTIEIDDVVIDY